MAGRFPLEGAGMDNLAFGAMAAGLLVAALALLWQTRRAAVQRSASRAAFFDGCRALFSDGLKAIAPTGFPRISGRYKGQTFDLQAVPDTLTYRKLPALWVLVTLPAPMPVRASFDLMIRPGGVAPFSNFHSLPDQITPPDGFPTDCAIRSDDPAHLPDEALLRRYLPLFQDARMKELVISPKGLRLVWLAEEANRGRYLFFRDAEMGRLALPASAIRPLLDSLLALQADLAAPMERSA
jgi:hypothetical protein